MPLTLSSQKDAKFIDALNVLCTGTKITDRKNSLRDVKDLESVHYHNILRQNCLSTINQNDHNYGKIIIALVNLIEKDKGGAQFWPDLDYFIKKADSDGGVFLQGYILRVIELIWSTMQKHDEAKRLKPAKDFTSILAHILSIPEYYQLIPSSCSSYQDFFNFYSELFCSRASKREKLSSGPDSKSSGYEFKSLDEFLTQNSGICIKVLLALIETYVGTAEIDEYKFLIRYVIPFFTSYMSNHALSDISTINFLAMVTTVLERHVMNILDDDDVQPFIRRLFMQISNRWYENSKTHQRQPKFKAEAIRYVNLVLRISKTHAASSELEAVSELNTCHPLFLAILEDLNKDLIIGIPQPDLRLEGDCLAFFQLACDVIVIVSCGGKVSCSGNLANHIARSDIKQASGSSASKWLFWQLFSWIAPVFLIVNIFE
jgi:hypothetical protein